MFILVPRQSQIFTVELREIVNLNHNFKYEINLERKRVSKMKKPKCPKCKKANMIKLKEGFYCRNLNCGGFIRHEG